MPFFSDYPRIKTIREIAKRKNVSVFLVGGFLRDRLLGRAKNDFDFAVEHSALKLAKAFAAKIKGAYVLLDEERGCARVAKKIKGELFTYDFADFRDTTIEGDLALRDFTINTLCTDLSRIGPKTEIDEVLVDVKRGLKDLKAGRIKRVSVKAFRDDPLRMMRAFSLQAALGFRIELSTLNQVRKEKDLIRHVSAERVREELFKVLETEAAGLVIRAMDRVGLLEQVIPQVRVMAGCTQGTYHHLDVWPHSVETLTQLEKILRRSGEDEELNVYLDELLAGGHSRKAVMKLAALLHDIGKPDAKRKERERTLFHGHENIGRSIVRNIAQMLKLSTRERYALEDMVRWHLRPGYLSNFKQPSDRAVYRYFRDTKDEAVSTLLLSLADQRATRGPATTQQDQDHHAEICLGLVRRHFQKKKEKPLKRLISGNDLIRTLKLRPSPLFAEILTAVEEQQMLGKLKNKREALAYAKQIAGKKRKKAGKAR